ncbi:MAG: peptidase family protein [Acidimicrobiales bacterium]|jgi:Lon protease-like protein|nr:peptidase family protein [Acidimicrobiales bacterium]
MTTRLPMFPLGAVLFPGLVMPLHVFEPRYRVLVHDCLTGTPEFGVVLIERGNEVGGGDSRFDVGTRARIIEARELPDGRWVLAVAGINRLRVASWLPDDPYPQADVVDLADGPAGPAGSSHRADVEQRLRRLLAMRTELGLPAEAATVDLAGDDAVAAAQCVALAGMGPLDAQRVLATDGVDARLGLVGELLADELDVLARRAQGG